MFDTCGNEYSELGIGFCLLIYEVIGPTMDAVNICLAFVTLLKSSTYQYGSKFAEQIAFLKFLSAHDITVCVSFHFVAIVNVGLFKFQQEQRR